MTAATIPVDNDQPSIVLNQLVVESGFFPARDDDPTGNPIGIPLGAIRTFANLSAAQSGSLGNEQPATGEILPIGQQSALFSLLGIQYGGNGFANFGLPNLAGTVMVGAGNGPSGQVFQGETYGQHSVTLTSANLPTVIGGGGQPITNDQPSLGVTYLIDVGGGFGSVDGRGSGLVVAGMIVPFLGNFAPDGYMVAAGQLLSIADHPILFAQLGTTYGGDGIQTFALPNLQDHTIIGAGNSGLGDTPLGQSVGSDTAAITKADLPPSLGGGQPIDNQQPSVALTYLICTNGLFLAPGNALVGNIP